jgi:hypothetical protein
MTPAPYIPPQVEPPVGSKTVRQDPSVSGTFDIFKNPELYSLATQKGYGPYLSSLNAGANAMGKSLTLDENELNDVVAAFLAEAQTPSAQRVLLPPTSDVSTRADRAPSPASFEGVLKLVGQNYLANQFRETIQQEPQGEQGGEPVGEPVNPRDIIIPTLTDQNIGNDVFDQLQTVLGRDLTIDEATLVRPIVEEGIRQNMLPSEISRATLNSLDEVSLRRSIEENLKTQTDLFTTEQERAERERGNLLAFLSEGGELDERSLANLFLTETPEQARALAQQTLLDQQKEIDEENARLAAERAQEEFLVQREQDQLRELLSGEVSRLEQALPKTRADISREILDTQQQAFNLGLPRIREEAQALGLLQSGYPLELSQNLLGNLELQRQQNLIAMARDDARILEEAKSLAAQEGRNLTQDDLDYIRSLRLSDRTRQQNVSDLFSQQAANLALQQTGNAQNQMQNLYNQQAGTVRQDLLGGQSQVQTAGNQASQQLFASREAKRARDFEAQQREIEMATLNRLAEEQRKGQKLGSLFNLGGALLGGAAGAFGGPQGALLGAGIGQSLGGSIGGAFGGTQSGAQNPYFNALDMYSQLFGGTKSQSQPNPYGVPASAGGPYSYA